MALVVVPRSDPELLPVVDPLLRVLAERGRARADSQTHARVHATLRGLAVLRGLGLFSGGKRRVDPSPAPFRQLHVDPQLLVPSLDPGELVVRQLISFTKPRASLAACAPPLHPRPWRWASRSSWRTCHS